MSKLETMDQFRVGCRRRSAVLGAAVLGAAALLFAACAGTQGSTPAAGHFESPLVQLKRLQGQVGHLHVDEVRYRADDKRLFQCSYTFGVVDASNPAAMTYLAENLTHEVPGDRRRAGCVHLAYDGDLVYTTHRGNLRNPTFVSGWDLSATETGRGRARMRPVQLPVLQEPGVSYEGIDVANHVVYVAIRNDGLGVYRRDASTNRLARVGTLAGLGNTWGVRVVGSTAYVTDIDGHLSVVDVSSPERPALLGRVAVGGVPKGLDVNGDTIYVAAGSDGIAVVDVSDRARPQVIGTADTPGPALRVAYSAGHLFVAAWTDARVYDVTMPSRPRFVGAVRLTTDVAYPDEGHPPVTARTKGIAADGDAVFVGNWWVLYSYRLRAERAAPSLRLPEEVNLMDFGRHDAGAGRTMTVEVANQGTAPLAVYDAWTSNPSFQVTPSSLTLAPGTRDRLAITYRAASADRETGLLHLRTDDPLQPQRSVFLVGNQRGLGLGQPLPRTDVQLLDGGMWSSTEAAGKVLVLAYFATFCPVCAEHVPELERHFWKKYKDRGVEIVAVDSHDNTVEGGMAGVADYVARFGNTHPVGLESRSTPTYAALVEHYRGANPFPVDVVVGRDGRISYIAREYDPDALEAAIEDALGE
jgi:hypothetical protein